MPKAILPAPRSVKSNVLSFLLSGGALCAGAVLLFVSNAPAQNLYVANWYNGYITQITPDGVQSTFASGLNSPGALAIDNSGDVFVTSWDDIVGTTDIIRIAPDGTKSTFASGLLYYDPISLVCDSTGDVFAAANGSVLKFTPSGVESTVFWEQGFVPEELAINTAGDLFVKCYLGYGYWRIIEITPDGTQIPFSWWIGGSWNPNNDLAINSTGDLFVSGGGIIQFTPAGAQSTFASASFGSGLACNNEGDVFAVDSSGQNIIEITPSGVQSTFASGLDGADALAFGSPCSRTLTGHVFCLCNGSPISNAVVQIGNAHNGTYSTTSDSDGSYSIGNIPPAVYTSVVAANNYIPLTNTVTIPSGSMTVTQNFALSPVPTLDYFGVGVNWQNVTSPSGLSGVRGDIDATNLYNHLKTDLSSIFGQGTIVPLDATSSSATNLSTITSQFNQFATSVYTNDTIILYVSSHGGIIEPQDGYGPANIEIAISDDLASVFTAGSIGTMLESLPNSTRKIVIPDILAVIWGRFLRLRQLFSPVFGAFSGFGGVLS